MAAAFLLIPVAHELWHRNSSPIDSEQKPRSSVLLILNGTTSDNRSPKSCLPASPTYDAFG